MPLKYRFQDVIIFLNDLLNLSLEEISKLAKTLSDARKFFTHYNEKYTIPSVQELLAAGRVLHFLLLALVYKAIGLDDSAIKEAALRFSYDGSLSGGIEVLLKQVDGVQYDNMFE